VVIHNQNYFLRPSLVTVSNRGKIKIIEKAQKANSIAVFNKIGTPILAFNFVLLAEFHFRKSAFFLVSNK
jgi:hypothetical protein